MRKKLIIIGASGHGKVIADIALKMEYDIQGFLDDDDSIKDILGFPVLGSVDKIKKYQQDCEFVIAIGNNFIREKIAKRYDAQWATLIHPSAVIGMDVEIGEGTVVMANAVINPSAKTGRHCIINTGAIVEHDNRLEDFVHISPGVALAGTVSVGKRTHIGIGACVRNNLEIGSEVVVGAGATVVKDIIKPGIYTGVPARRSER